MSKIIGNTVGMGLPKPNLMQTDPTKGDYVKGKEEFLAQAGAGSGQNVTRVVSRVIDLEKYGITETEYESPFTAEMYEVAHANGVGLQKAIDDAAAAGIECVVIPAGSYPLCYSAESHTLINAGAVDIEGYGARLYIIYDDNGVNPYAPETNAHLLGGDVIRTNGNVSGLIIEGERALRTHASARYREGSHGIVVDSHSTGKTIRDCSIHRFSGDAIGFSVAFENMEVSEGLAFQIGTVTDGEVTLGTGDNLISDPFRFGHKVDVTKPVVYAPSGYTYIFPSRETPKVHLYDADDAYITTMRVPQNTPFRCPENAYSLRLELDPTPGTDFSTSFFRVGNMSAYGVTIDNCELAYNQRGGVSNLPSGSIIRNCRIHDNGGAYDGMPAFYDGTRFGIDIEDWYADHVTVEGCIMWGQNYDILWRCRKLTVRDCVSFSGISGMRCVDLTLADSRFYGGVGYEPMSYGTRRAIGCQIKGSVPDTLDVIDSRPIAPVSGRIDDTDRNKLNMFDPSGKCLFFVDLTYLGKKLGDEIATAGLLCDIDLTAASAENLTFEDKTGSLSVTLKDPAVISPLGIGNSELYGNQNIAMWKEMQEFGEELSVEITCWGLPSGAIFPSGGASGGLIVPTTAGGAMSTAPGSIKVPVHGVTPSYINTAGESVSMRLYGFGDRLILPDGSATTKYADIEDLRADRAWHIVVVYSADGSVIPYINGYRCDSMSVTDFQAWDFSKYAQDFALWRGAAGMILQTVRLYNRRLTDDDVRNNALYELAHLGNAHRIYAAASNATITHLPMVVGDEPYSTAITAKDGYTLEGATVSVVMGGVDITETAYADGAVNIEVVTGDVVITVAAVSTT